MIDVFDVVCLRCKDNEVVRPMELFHRQVAIISRWMIISLNFIDKQHEVFYCNENVTLTTTSKEITSFLIYFGL